MNGQISQLSKAEQALLDTECAKTLQAQQQAVLSQQEALRQEGRAQATLRTILILKGVNPDGYRYDVAEGVGRLVPVSETNGPSLLATVLPTRVEPQLGHDGALRS